MGRRVMLGIVLAALSAGAGTGVAIAATHGTSHHARVPAMHAGTATHHAKMPAMHAGAMMHHCHGTPAAVTAL